MRQCQKIARFALHTRFEQLDALIIDQLKKHLLDTIGSMIYASQRPTIQKLIRYLGYTGSGGDCSTPFAGSLHFPQAAQLYTALLRYPDFMDNFLAKEATCHPSDNVGGLLAAAQLSHSSGKEFLTAMAVSYLIECKLCETYPVMMKGFDHTVLLGFSMTAGMSKLIGLNEEETSNALGISGCFINPTVTSRASYTYEWKGLASSMVANSCADIVIQAQQGITGPIFLFEGPKGYKEIYDMELNVDWENEKFDLIKKCILKSHNAEVHTQSAIEAALHLRREHNLDPANIKQVSVETFLTTYHIVGGGEYGDRTKVHTKEQADHSLPYLIAVALLDGHVQPEQLLVQRINRDDVQDLLKRVEVTTAFPIHEPKKIVGMLDPYTRIYPERVPVEITIEMNNGTTFHRKEETFKGFFTNPFSWQDTEDKFDHLTKGILDREQNHKIKEFIHKIEDRKIAELLPMLAGKPETVSA